MIDKATALGRQFDTVSTFRFRLAFVANQIRQLKLHPGTNKYINWYTKFIQSATEEKLNAIQAYTR